MKNKICKICLIEKHEEDFRINNHYRRIICRECERKINKAHYDKNPEKQREVSRNWRRANIKKQRYGITNEQFNTMLVEQQNICKICGEVKELCVDHCHSTKRVRGLLCRKCNAGIGLLKDSVKLLQRAIDYLQKIS